MVLAMQAFRSYEKRKKQRQREQLEKGAALALEALRINQETGEPYEEILQRLIGGKLAAGLAQPATLPDHRQPLTSNSRGFVLPL